MAKKTKPVPYRKRVTQILKLVGNGVTIQQVSEKIGVSNARTTEIMNAMADDKHLSRKAGAGSRPAVYTKPAEKAAPKSNGVTKHYDEKPPRRPLNVKVSAALFAEYRLFCKRNGLSEDDQARMFEGIIRGAMQAFEDPLHEIKQRQAQLEIEAGRLVLFNGTNA